LNWFYSRNQSPEIMKSKTILLLAIGTLFISCGKKYNCEIVHHTGIGAGIDITTNRTYRGSYEKMLAFEKANTTEDKTTTCH
jgi:hypothetical protein